MNSEVEQSIDDEAEGKEDCQAISENTQCVGESSDENNEVCMDSSCTENEKESPCNTNENDQTQTDTNATQSNEIPENFQQPQSVPASMDQEQLNVDAVVKEEPLNEVIDYGMPIAKATLDTNVTQSEEDTNANVVLGSSGNDESRQDKANSEYLDGLVTPIIPRLRVKSEFAFPAPFSREKSREDNKLNQNCDSNNTEAFPPPPPASFLPSNSSTEFVADGIATPRLSLAPKNRLIRVKTEFSIPPGTPRHNQQESISFPEDYFDDLLVTTNNDREAGEISHGTSDDGSEDDPIPPDYFDDLLHDKCKERIQMAQNIELEEKYSDRLREYERLKNKEKSRKNRKKQKKSKKKSKKRSRSRSLSPYNHTNRNDQLNLYKHDRNKRSRISPLHQEMSSGSIFAHREVMDENIFSANASFEIKSEFPRDNFEDAEKELATSMEDLDEIEDVLTPREKREKVFKRATNLLNYIKENSDDDVFSTFLFTSIVRKLPASHSYVQQHIYENRSPLHTVNNISYKFNSHSSRFNMEEWGLSVLPPRAAKIAKLTGCDAQFIHDKLKTIKIPAKLKIKQEPNNEAENVNEEDIVETTSSLYSNVMTQTDDISEFDFANKKRGYDVGVQVEPNVYSIGSQTLETQSPTKDAHKDDDIPIMQLIHNLNENQLMAMHAFAELIKEPNKSDNAMEMYKIQMKILEIYKMSQIASVLPTSEPPISNYYTTKLNHNRNQPDIFIQSVKGADGKQFSVNDPRAKSTAYTQRIVNEGADPSRKYNSRYVASSHESKYYYSSSRSSQATRHYRSDGYNNTTSPTRTKHYGRGALRR